MTRRKSAPQTRPKAERQDGLQLYAASFKPDEREELEALLATGVQDEIAMFRVVIRRAFALATAAEEAEGRSEALRQAIQVVNTFGTAALRLGSLLKTQQALGESSTDVAAAITQALNEVVEEMGWK